MARKTFPRTVVETLLTLLEIPVGDVKSVYIEPELGSVTVRKVKGKGGPEYFDLTK